jgi:hypothetical protein
MVVVNVPSNAEPAGAEAVARGSAEPGPLVGSAEHVGGTEARDPGAVPARAEGPERSRQRSGSVGRVVPGALATLLLVLGGVLLVPRPNAVPLQTIDVALEASVAAPDLGFVPSVPVGLPGWTATTAVVHRRGTSGIVTWHVGFVTPQGNYAGIEQATRSTIRWENVLDAGGARAGTVDIDGAVWDHLEKAERVTTTLILRRPGRVTLITARGGGLADAITLVRSLPPDTPS